MLLTDVNFVSGNSHVKAEVFIALHAFNAASAESPASWSSSWLILAHSNSLWLSWGLNLLLLVINFSNVDVMTVDDHVHTEVLLALHAVIVWY